MRVLNKFDQKAYDFLVVGSGFAGSITAMALANSGFQVCLVEKNKHPRFTVGESSTPIADMILRDLSDDYNLPFLKKLSRYGEWQKNYPEIVCGLKRGFSYYHHQKGKRFESDNSHSNELLVAASENDMNSDTNWLRSDVDHFLVNKANESEVDYLDECEIQSLVRDLEKGIWDVNVLQNQKSSKIEASWIIDATGSSSFSESFFGTSSSSDRFETHSEAIFTHFEGVDRWSSYLERGNFHTDDYPYNPDHSALHHIIDEGWVWMLRFNNDLLSSGVVIDTSDNELKKESLEKFWKRILDSYPSVNEIFKHSKIAESPGRMLKTGRLQRKLSSMHGDGWVALHHTAGFVDPLHSTGIAHALTGVEKILKIFAQHKRVEDIEKGLKKIEEEYTKELSFIDLMVSSCYLSRRHNELFNAAVMLYFVASVRYEQGRLRGDIPSTFLCAGDSRLREIIVKTHADIKKVKTDGFVESEVQELIQKIKSRIKPYNSIGLMNPSNSNMYVHTAVKL